MLTKAKRIGLLEVVETERANKSQSSNLYIFLRYNTIEPPRTKAEQPQPAPPKEKVVEQLNHLKTSISSIKTNKQITKRMDTLDYTFTLEYVPKRFRDLVQCFSHEFNNATVIEEFWRLVKIQTYYLTYLDEDYILNLAIDSFKQMINKYKKKKINNPYGYFWGVINRKLDYLYYEALAELEVN
jgi:hypothetical protein